MFEADPDDPVFSARVLEVCGDDEALRRDVESLLAQERSADGFLAGPAVNMAAKLMQDEPGASMIGRQIGG